MVSRHGSLAPGRISEVRSEKRIGRAAARHRPIGRTIGHSVLGLAGLWSLVAALAFSGPVLAWLVLAAAAGFGVLTLAGLTGYEVTRGNVGHRVEITRIACGHGAHLSG